MSLDTANQRIVESRNKGLKRQRTIADEAVRSIMADDKGRAYLVELLRESQVLLNVIGATEPGAMFREGRKVLGLKIMADVQRCCPAQFPGLIQAVFAAPPKTDQQEKDDGRDSDDSE